MYLLKEAEKKVRASPHSTGKTVKVFSRGDDRKILVNEVMAFDQTDHKNIGHFSMTTN